MCNYKTTCTAVCSWFMNPTGNLLAASELCLTSCQLKTFFYPERQKSCKSKMGSEDYISRQWLTECHVRGMQECWEDWNMCWMSELVEICFRLIHATVLSFQAASPHQISGRNFSKGLLRVLVCCLSLSLCQHFQAGSIITVFGSRAFLGVIGILLRHSEVLKNRGKILVSSKLCM